LGLRKPNNKIRIELGLRKPDSVLGFLARYLSPYKYIRMYYFRVNHKIRFFDIYNPSSSILERLERERERLFFIG